MTTALVVGMGVTGEAVARHFLARGLSVVAVEDAPTEATGERLARLGTGVAFEAAPAPGRLAELVAGADVIVPSPGVPHSHAVYRLAAAAGVPVVSEIELAARATDVPIVAVTGTNGKTTVTTLITEMLRTSGRHAVAAGNIGLPLVQAVEGDADVFVAEVSSFQLEYTSSFRPHVAVWLNVSEDHLDWHPSYDHYVAAKARIWANQREGDVAIVSADDEMVMRQARHAPAAVITFGIDTGDWRVSDGALTAPDGEEIVSVAGLPRALPHDLANDLAATAATIAAGGTLDACRAVLRNFSGLPHRVQLVGDAGGVKYYDDSKATTPASVVAATRGFESVVLIAGGRNKGLSMSPLAQLAEHVRAVVAIGEASSDVEAAFAGVRPVVRAASMREAVARARELARDGDVVLLSPGCASFDWYRNYAERGDDFAEAVREVAGAGRPR